MLCRKSLALGAVAVALVLTASARADLTEQLKKGTPEIKSAGPLAFAPDGVLLVGDPQAGLILALDTGDRKANGNDRPSVDGIDEKIAALLGTDVKQIKIVDAAVNPISGNTYLSVARGAGPDAKAVILRLDRTGKLSEFALKDVKFDSVALTNNAEGQKRVDAITHIAWVGPRNALRTVPLWDTV